MDLLFRYIASMYNTTLTWIQTALCMGANKDVYQFLFLCHLQSYNLHALPHSILKKSPIPRSGFCDFERAAMGGRPPESPTE